MDLLYADLKEFWAHSYRSLILLAHYHMFSRDQRWMSWFQEEPICVFHLNLKTIISHWTASVLSCCFQPISWYFQTDENNQCWYISKHCCCDISNLFQLLFQHVLGTLLWNEVVFTSFLWTIWWNLLWKHWQFCPSEAWRIKALCGTPIITPK